MTAAELARYITARFDVEGPFEADQISTCPCDECGSVRHEFTGWTSATLPPVVIDRNFDKLPLMSPMVFRAFLPSYMVRGVEASDDPVVGANEVLEFTTYSLVPSADDSPAHLSLIHI